MNRNRFAPIQMTKNKLRRIQIQRLIRSNLHLHIVTSAPSRRPSRRIIYKPSRPRIGSPGVRDKYGKPPVASRQSPRGVLRC
jgi:hypothetical protein